MVSGDRISAQEIAFCLEVSLCEVSEGSGSTLPFARFLITCMKSSASIYESASSYVRR